MLDELLERIMQLTTSEQDDAQAALEEVRRLVQDYLDSGIVAFVRKVAERMNATMHDDEISMIISAAQADMIRLGIRADIVEKAEDQTVRLVIVTYCRAHFGLDKTDMEKNLTSYELLTDQMRKDSKYKKDMG